MWHSLFSKWKAGVITHKSQRINQADDWGLADLLLPTPQKLEITAPFTMHSPDYKDGEFPRGA
jgi:hypothetical protein